MLVVGSEAFDPTRGRLGTLTLGEERVLVPSPALLSAPDISFYFEFMHQKPHKVSLKAWAVCSSAFLNSSGPSRIVLREKPSVRGPKANKADILKDSFLAVHVL